MILCLLSPLLFSCRGSLGGEDGLYVCFVVHFWTTNLMSHATVCLHVLLGQWVREHPHTKKLLLVTLPLSKRYYLFGNITIIQLNLLNVGADHHLGIDKNAMGDELRGSGGPPALPHASIDPPRP